MINDCSDGFLWFFSVFCCKFSILLLCSYMFVLRLKTKLRDVECYRIERKKVLQKKATLTLRCYEVWLLFEA